MIAEQMHALSIDDLINAIIGFSHPQSSKRLDILDLLEARLVIVLGMNQVSLADTVFCLSELSQRLTGSKLLMDNITEKLEQTIEAKYQVTQMQNFDA